MSPATWSAFRRVTRGLPETVVIEVNRRSWKVPRIYIALHSVHGGDLPELAGRYGWEELDPGEAQPDGLSL